MTQHVELASVYEKMSGQLEKKSESLSSCPASISAIPRRSSGHRTGGSTPSSATKRPAGKPNASSPSKKQRNSSWVTLDDGLSLKGVPLVRSGVSNLFDEMGLTPIVSDLDK